MTERCLLLLSLGLAPLLGCGEVTEVLSAPDPVALGGSAGTAQAGSAPGGSAGTGGVSGGDAGEPAAGGAQLADPQLGVFVDSGDAHSCATRFGILYCWGANSDGRLGLGDNLDRNAPVRVGFDADWTAVATGMAHTCALKSDGSVWCFGANTTGQLGQGHNLASNVPLRVVLPGAAVELSAQTSTACVVLDSGELWCWGKNWEGNIGLDDTHPGLDQLLPVRSGEESDWLLSGTGDGHTCGIRGAGLLFGWGRNTAANLGLGSTVDGQRRAATQIGLDSDWVSVVAGQDASCGMRSGGKLFCWGGNEFGTLGLGDRDQRLVPAEVVAGRVWNGISIDTFHGCGIDADQNLYCWGRNIEGQLGTSDLEDRLLPEPVGAGFAQVAVGRMFSCSAMADGRVFCTGENVAGQLGLADNARRNSFTEVSFP
jgi:alpha-tubulin suppressor-like RCC1 family protein